MTTITTRTAKGSPLTIAEVDANFTNLNNGKAETANPTFTGAVKIDYGSTTNPGLGFTANTGTGLYGATGKIGMSISGASYLDIGSTQGMAIGLSAVASGFNALAIGYGASGIATICVAIGAYANATGVAALAISGSATADYAVAIGVNANATGVGTIAINGSATADYSVAVGISAVARQYGQVSMGGGPPLVLLAALNIQKSLFLLSVNTTTVAPQIMSVGVGSISIISIAGMVLAFKGQIIASDSVGVGFAAISIEGLMSTNATNVGSIIGTPSKVLIAASGTLATLTTANIVIAATTGGLNISALGIGVVNIIWGAAIETTEMGI